MKQGNRRLEEHKPQKPGRTQHHVGLSGCIRFAGLPTSGHRGGHSTTYFKEVSDALEAAAPRGKEAVYEVLDRLRKDLISSELLVR